MLPTRRECHTREQVGGPAGKSVRPSSGAGSKRRLRRERRPHENQPRRRRRPLPEGSGAGPSRSARLTSGVQWEWEEVPPPPSRRQSGANGSVSTPMTPNRSCQAAEHGPGRVCVAKRGSAGEPTACVPARPRERGRAASGRGPTHGEPADYSERAGEESSCPAEPSAAQARDGPRRRHAVAAQRSGPRRPQHDGVVARVPSGRPAGTDANNKGTR